MAQTRSQGNAASRGPRPGYLLQREDEVEDLAGVDLLAPSGLSPAGQPDFADTGWEPKQIYAQLDTACRIGAWQGSPS